MDGISETFEPLLRDARQSGDRGSTRHITIGPNAFEALGDFLERDLPGKVEILLCDSNTAHVAQDLGAHLEAKGRPFRLLVLEPSHGHDELICDQMTVDSMATFLRVSPAFNPVAVGAGTLNDIAKMASFQADRSYVAVPTAASMNGYTSAIAAVLKEGVKRTLPCHQPVGIFADPEVIRSAPPRLNRAGFGDLLSKPFSNADWLLSHHIRQVPYSSEPSKFLDAPFTELLKHAKGIASSDSAAISLLLETLLLSGFSMAMAGSSAPASGGEHLISHYWDMEQHCQHEELRALHGTQVGIATWISALLYQRLMNLSADELVAGACIRSAPPSLQEITAAHPRLSPQVCREIQEQLALKERVGPDQEEELLRLKREWPGIKDAILPSLLGPDQIALALGDAGCPMRASEIGVDGDHLVHTIRVCRQIRRRYVALDLMADCGVLEGWAQEVAQATEGAQR